MALTTNACRCVAESCSESCAEYLLPFLDQCGGSAILVETGFQSQLEVLSATCPRPDDGDAAPAACVAQVDSLLNTVDFDGMSTAEVALSSAIDCVAQRLDVVQHDASSGIGADGSHLDDTHIRLIVAEAMAGTPTPSPPSTDDIARLQFLVGQLTTSVDVLTSNNLAMQATIDLLQGQGTTSGGGGEVGTLPPLQVPVDGMACTCSLCAPEGTCILSEANTGCVVDGGDCTFSFDGDAGTPGDQPACTGTHDGTSDLCLPWGESQPCSCMDMNLPACPTDDSSRGECQSEAGCMHDSGRDSTTCRRTSDGGTQPFVSYTMSPPCCQRDWLTDVTVTEVSGLQETYDDSEVSIKVGWLSLGRWFRFVSVRMFCRSPCS